MFEILPGRIALLSFPYFTVLCKRNANEIWYFSFFVLAKIRRNFTTKFRQSAREFSWSQTKFPCYLSEISFCRIFVGEKIRTREISPGQRFALAIFPVKNIVRFCDYLELICIWKFTKWLFSGYISVSICCIFENVTSQQFSFGQELPSK